MLVTNNSPGPRGFNVLVDGEVRMALLQPGDQMEITPLPGCRVFAGLLASKQLVSGNDYDRNVGGVALDAGSPSNLNHGLKGQ